MWLAASSIGVNALQSFVGGRSAYKQQQANVAMQRAQAYQNQAREYAQLTESIKAQGRYNEAVTQAEAYNFSNTLHNQGTMQLRDAQLKGVMARNKLQLRTEGRGAVGSIAVGQASVGAVGASARAMQQDVQKQVGTALSDLEQQRQNQVYDLHSQNQAMWTQFYQNQTKIDDSTINEAFLPQDPIILGTGSGSGGKFLPHLIASGISFGTNEMMQNWSLGLNQSNQKQSSQPVFSQGGGTATAYPYRR